LHTCFKGNTIKINKVQSNKKFHFKNLPRNTTLIKNVFHKTDGSACPPLNLGGAIPVVLVVFCNKVIAPPHEILLVNQSLASGRVCPKSN